MNNIGRANSTAVADDSATPSATTNVVSNNNTNPFRRAGTPRPKPFNDSGVQLIKGGSPLGAGFFDSCTTAYCNLVNSPLALILFIVGCFGAIALHSGAVTPLGAAAVSAISAANDNTNAYAVRSIASIFGWLFAMMTEYQFIVVPFFIFAGIYMAKPSSNNAWLCGTLTIISWISSLAWLELLVLGQITLLYTQMRNPTYKFAWMLVGLFCVILGFTHTSNMVGLKALTAAYPKPKLGADEELIDAMFPQHTVEPPTVEDVD